MNDDLHLLVCPECEDGTELFLLESVTVERKLGFVDELTTEILDLDLDSMDNFRVYGIVCNNCGFRHIGEDWKSILVKGETLASH